MLGCDTSAVHARAEVEGWRKFDFRTAKARNAHRAFIEAATFDGEGGFDGDLEGSFAIDPIADWTEADAVAVALDSAPEEARETTVAAEAEAAPWEGDVPHDENVEPLALLARSARVLARRLAALLNSAEAGGRLNKAEIDGLLALARMTERWETLAKERAAEEEMQSDEEIARTLRKIDQRIITLARAEAERLVAARARSAECGSGAA